MAHPSPVRNHLAPGSSAIPDKLYFRIGEVARLCEVAPYVLRFWESEFPQLKPNKGGSGQRLYRRREVETALRIKTLLYDEGYTIPGARQLLKGEGRQPEPQLPLVAGTTSFAQPYAQTERLEQLRTELQDLLAIVSEPPTVSPHANPPRRQRSLVAVRRPSEKLFDFEPARPEETGKDCDE